MPLNKILQLDKLTFAFVHIDTSNDLVPRELIIKTFSKARSYSRFYEYAKGISSHVISDNTKKYWHRLIENNTILSWDKQAIQRTAPQNTDFHNYLEKPLSDLKDYFYEKVYRPESFLEDDMQSNTSKESVDDTQNRARLNKNTKIKKRVSISTTGTTKNVQNIDMLPKGEPYRFRQAAAVYERWRKGWIEFNTYLEKSKTPPMDLIIKLQIIDPTKFIF